MHPLKYFLLVTLCLFASISCSRIQKIASSDAESGIEVRLILDHAPSDQGTSPTLSLYAPGEMVKVTVEIVNHLGKKVSLLIPFAAAKRTDSNINFSVMEGDGTDVLRRVPVISRRRIAPEKRELAPGESLKRDFFFVDLTRHAGDFRLQADFGVPNKKGIQDHYFSKPVDFQVKGPARWHRTVEGLLTKQDAMAIAVSKYGKPVRAAQAKLVENDAGIYDWLVTLTAEDGSKTNYFVSPYGAFVRAAGKPAKNGAKEQSPKPPSTPIP